MKVIIKHRYGDFEKEVNPKFTKGKIHIYGGGTSGYDYRSVSRGLEKITKSRMNVHGYYEYS